MSELRERAYLSRSTDHHPPPLGEQETFSPSAATFDLNGLISASMASSNLNGLSTASMATSGRHGLISASTATFSL